MSSNPLEDTPEREARIRERAYMLWKADGCPHGRDAEFWERAKELIGMEDSTGAAELPIASNTDQDNFAGRGVDEAEIQENYGEFPGRLTDQGDRSQTPMTRAKLRRSGTA